ncbi:MAG TPA: cytochrome c3 family protein, partial [Nitrospiria bacterium]|nr:cytochrome c3 family protein [Nitrospiria bacterium]
NPPLWDKKTTVKSFGLAPLTPVETPQPSYPFGPSSSCLACHDDALAAGIHDPKLNHPVASAYPRQPDGHFVARRNTPDLARYWSIPDRTSSGVSLPTGPHSEYLSLPVGSDSKDPAITSRMVRTTAGFIHCDSCHNPHNDSTAPFLRASSKTLCLICHDR